MSSFALYRFPHENYCTLLSQKMRQPIELLSYSDLSGKEGFVIAPFNASKDEPILLLEPEKTKKILLSDFDDTFKNSNSDSENYFDAVYEGAERLKYTVDYENFSSQIASGKFSKIVLARRKVVKSKLEIAPEELFKRACKLYPRMFIALVHTERCGTWLTASPEILLEGHERNWRTIALAGTMKLEGCQLNFDASNEMCDSDMIKWSDKNIQEQGYVAKYIKECLDKFSNNVVEEGPFTVRAGNLVHLRSNFDFTLQTSDNIGELINSLHPTPAVCGIPKDTARRFILKNESVPRHYYSGFMGPLNTQYGTHLYVSLRCMNIEGRTYKLHAGGGLVKNSEEAMEWKETEDKIETMGKCLVTKKI
ncbi:MAG: isochorismate synthase [Prevotella sp.]|nr:isochorismate synthase [Prevotella sp.]